MKCNVCVHCLSWLSVQYNNKKKSIFDFYSTEVGTLLSVLYFNVTERFRQKTNMGMGVIFQGWERGGIFPQFFRGIGTFENPLPCPPLKPEWCLADGPHNERKCPQTQVGYCQWRLQDCFVGGAKPFRGGAN